jgi:choline dehydrogenase
VAREIGSSQAFDDWRDEEALPGPDVRDETELRDYLRCYMDPYDHTVGTCRIRTDPAAVVDPQIRLRGIDRLRVADASVMPTVPGATTTPPCLPSPNALARFSASDRPARRSAVRKMSP